MRSHSLTPVAVLLLSTVPASAKHYAADRYDVKLQLDQRGSLAVTETVVFRFGAGPFHYAFREIATTETDGVEGVEAWMDGRLCAPGNGSGEVEIDGASKVRVKWHFLPLSNEVHTFTVRYRVAGTLRTSGDAQTLIWRALPSERAYRIEASDIVVEYPRGIHPSTIALRGRGPGFIAGDGQASVHLRELRPSENVVVQARFAAGAFASSPPFWQTAGDRRRNDLMRGVGGASVLSVAVGAILGLWMFRIRGAVQSVAATSPPASAVSSPPDSLAPAVAASLIGKMGWGNLGTLLDLARRGLLRIEEAPRGFLGARRFKIEVSDVAVPLAPHERVMMETIFQRSETSVMLSDVSPRLAAGSGKISAAIRAELNAAGLVDEARSKARSKLLTIGGIALAAGFALILAGVASYKSSESAVFAGGAAALGAATMIVGLFGLILGGAQKVWSDSGMVAAAQWEAFANYLSQAARGRQPFPNARHLDQLLPYAAAFGVGALLVKRGKKLGGISLPSWFEAIHDADGADSAAFIAFMTSSDSSVPGDGGAGAGGGASGGGSSGAG